ncbi:MAG: hypothetical protein IKW04_02395 [Clostridia bacterium]|nr:hypothetical protein [Clostridia bacterium]
MNEVKKIAVGLDIGTTTVSAIVLDAEQKQVLQIYNVANDSKIESAIAGAFIQNPARISEIVTEILEDILANYSVTSIGVTGQMHGILLISPDGEALSPLYTWQDMQASLGEDSSCEQIQTITGYRVPAGYGLATLYHLIRTNQVPKEPYVAGTIMDFITMKLTGISRPVMHITNAASWGFFSTSQNNFDFDAVEKLGIPKDVLPLVTADKTVVGEYKNIPVAVGIGDNQAAFMGSVSDPNKTLLVNIGTGSQVSLLSDQFPEEESLLVEARPFDGNSLLYSGSCLCGGRSYALLEKFFHQFATKCGLEDKPYYDVMNCLAKEGLASGNIVNISTTFAGTRENPNLRGAITNIGEENFTPQSFAAGLLAGMAEELYELYQKMPHEGVTKLVASGNGVRKNPVLRQVIEEVFGMKLTIPDHTEEAAFGVAMFGAEAI